MFSYSQRQRARRNYGLNRWHWVFGRGLGNPDFCWLSFQTLWDDLVARDQSFLD